MKYMMNLSLLIVLMMCTSYFNFAQETIEIDTFMFKPEYYEDLDEALAKPDHVLYLNLTMVKLTSLPASIGNLKNVIRLDLSYNKFTTLPKEIGQLRKVEYLNLSGCYNLISVPAELANMKNVQVLHIKDMLRSQAALVDKIIAMFPNAEISTSWRSR